MATFLGVTINASIATRLAEAYGGGDVTTTLTELQERIRNEVRTHVRAFEKQEAIRNVAESDFDL